MTRQVRSVLVLLIIIGGACLATTGGCGRDALDPVVTGSGGSGGFTNPLLDCLKCGSSQTCCLSVATAGQATCQPPTAPCSVGFSIGCLGPISCGSGKVCCLHPAPSTVAITTQCTSAATCASSPLARVMCMRDSDCPKADASAATCCPLVSGVGICQSGGCGLGDLSWLAELSAPERDF